jgi:hypothetical protein
VRLNPLDYGYTSEVHLSPRDRFRIDSFVPVIDMLVSALSTRVSAYKEICDRFGFLHHIDKLTTEELRTAAKNLVDIYSSDIEDTLGDELNQFCRSWHSLVKTKNHCKEVLNSGCTQ